MATINFSSFTSTILNQALTAITGTDTVYVPNSTTYTPTNNGFPAVQFEIVIDSELMLVTAINLSPGGGPANSHAWTVSRAQGYTAGVVHQFGASIIHDFGYNSATSMVQLTPTTAQNAALLISPATSASTAFASLGDIELRALTRPAAPSNPVFTAQASTLAAGTYWYAVSYITGNGETGINMNDALNPTNVLSVTVPASSPTPPSSVTLTIPTGPNAVIARSVYRTKAGATNAGPYYLLSTTTLGSKNVSLADNTTTSYVDVTPDATLGTGNYVAASVRNNSGGNLNLKNAATGTVNFGLINFGVGNNQNPFQYDITQAPGANQFSGSAGGTSFAHNGSPTFTGNYFDYQINGSRFYSFDYMGNINLFAWPAPTAPTVTAAAGTTTFYYVVTYVTANGETTVSPIGTTTTSAATGSVNNTLTIPTGPAYVTQRKVYRTKTGGATTGPYYLLATGTGHTAGTVSDNTTTSITDTSTDAAITKLPPVSNTSGGNYVTYGDVFIEGVPAASSTRTLTQFGVLNVGYGNWAGGTNAFSGTANGTYLAINSDPAFTGNLISAQLGGSSRMSLAYNGNLNVAGNIQTGTAQTSYMDYIGGISGSPTYIDLSSATGPLISNVTTIANIPLRLRGMAGQTGDLQQWQSSTPTTLAKVDASGNITGNTLVSTIATGTAPLTVTSTTVVANLNASLLGGNAAASFATLSGTNTWTNPQTVTGTSATPLIINPATYAAGNLFDAQVNAVSQFAVRFDGSTTGTPVNQNDYFYNNIIPGGLVVSTPGNQQVSVTAGVAYINGKRVVTTSTQTLSALTFSTNYWIRLSSAGVVSAVTVAAGANQVASPTGSITLAYASVAATPGAVTLVDLRQSGMTNTPASSITSMSNGVLSPAPTELIVPTVAAAAGTGMVDAGAHVWAFTIVTLNGETTPSMQSVSTTVVAGTSSMTISNIGLGFAGGGTVARRIYRSKAGTTSPLYHVGTIPDAATTTFVDQLPDSLVGLPAPSFVDAYNVTHLTGHIYFGGRAAPTVNNAVNVTVTLLAGSNDTRGIIHMVAGATAPLANATIATFNFGTTYGTSFAPIITLTPVVDSTATAVPTGTYYVNSPFPTTFNIRCTAALAINGIYRLNYFIAG